MERHFILPLTIAAALHAGLLFGFRRPAIQIPPAVSKIIRWTPSDPQPLDPTPPPEQEEATVAPKGATSDPPPSLVERPTVLSPTDFPVPIPEHPPVTTVNLTTIPRGPIGPPDGGNITDIGGPRPLNFKDLDNVPRARSQVGPAYPPEARRDGRAGEVMVEFTVDESGAVHEPRAVKSTDRIFEEPALRAVARWRFEPGLRNGRAVRFRMAVPIVFSLSEN